MMFYSLAEQVTGGGGFAPSPLVLLPEAPRYDIVMRKSTVVNHPPDFCCHLTTIDGIDFPHFAAFCFFHARVTFCSQVFELGKSRQNGAEYGFSGG